MKNKYLNILINGSEGFIGSHLKNLFINKNVDFKAIDLKLGNHLNDFKGENDKRNVVVHLAATTSVTASFEKPGDFYRNNLNSLIDSLEWCRENNGKIIYISSYVYGKEASLPTNETQNTSAHNPYAQSKLIGEELCKAYFRDNQVSYLILRPFNIYGSGHSNEFVISRIIEQVKNGNTEILIQNPNPKRDFVYIADLVEALYLAVTSEINNETINLCSGTSYSIGEVCQMIQELSPEKLNFLFEENFKRKGDVDVTLGSNEKALRLLNWQPKYSLKEGLKAIISSF